MRKASFTSLSVRNKFLVGLIPAILFTIIVVVSVNYLNTRIQTLISHSHEAFVKYSVLTRLDSLNAKLGDAAKAFTLTGDIRWQKQYDTLSAEFDAYFDSVVKNEKDKSQLAVLAAYKSLIDKIKGTELLILLKTRENDTKSAKALFDELYISQQKAANDILAGYIRTEQEIINSEIHTALEEVENFEKILFMMVLIFLTIIGLLTFNFLSLFVIHPLENLVATAKAVGAGDLNARAEVHSGDEVGKLAETFNAMTETLANQFKKLDGLLQQQNMSAKLLIRRDLELTRANEQLQELDKRKSEFLSVVAHQLRTPLSGIKWTLNMLLNGDLGPLTNDQKVFLLKGYESNQRMIALIEDMLGADRVSSGKLHYDYVPIQVLDLIDNVIYDILQQANKKNIQIEYADRKDLPKVLVDPDKIRAVVQNLLENAIKYTPANGKIRIHTKLDGTFVQIGIEDTGIGIPEEQQKNIFSRFFRASNAIKVETDGSGLGLFIVKGIIERHGGNIWFESNEGKGTTFYFTLKVE
jgi:signal transduction histidine kinase